MRKRIMNYELRIMKKITDKFSIMYRSICLANRHVLGIKNLIQTKRKLQTNNYPKGASFAYQLQTNRGFTLIEIIVYMGLLMIIMGVLTEIFASIIDNQLRSQNLSNVTIDGRYIYSRFIYDVNRAASITQPASLGSSSATLELVINGQNYTYNTSGNNLLISDASSSSVLNGFGTTVTGLNFTRIGNVNGKHTVRINFTITGSIQSGQIESKAFQTTAGLR